MQRAVDMMQSWTSVISVCRESLVCAQSHHQQHPQVAASSASVAEPAAVEQPEMPGRRGLCWCLGGSPPEITYTRDHSDGIALKPFQPLDIPPMPAEDDLNVMFADLVVSVTL